MHEEKREVYVVTALDKQAWPSGRGGIRFGFKPEVVSQYTSKAAFLSAYAAAVARYKRVRDSIDECLEQHLEVSAELTEQEYALRHAMQDFIHIKPLAVGDVIKVPQRLPHGLLHGVEVIEFQTPVYERKILSFSQKVLTQTHWDTASALDLAHLFADEASQALEVVLTCDEARIESIVDFDDFCVRRINVGSNAYDYSFEHGRAYALVMVVTGRCRYNASTRSVYSDLATKQAALFARSLFNQALHCEADSIVLVAYPN